VKRSTFQIELRLETIWLLFCRNEDFFFWKPKSNSLKHFKTFSETKFTKFPWKRVEESKLKQIDTPGQPRLSRLLFFRIKTNWPECSFLELFEIFKIKEKLRHLWFPFELTLKSNHSWKISIHLFPMTIQWINFKKSNTNPLLLTFILVSNFKKENQRERDFKYFFAQIASFSFRECLLKLK